MIENKSNVKVKSSTERNFGIVFSIFFLIIFFYPLLSNGILNYWAIYVSVILLILSFFFPNTLRIPNRLWFKFGLFIGHLVSPIIMGLVYFVTVVPTGLIIKLLGKKLMVQKFDKNLKTYWISKKEIDTSMKNQF